MKKVSFRKIVSLTSLTSFLFIIATGVVLYIVPHGRVAYWADWHLWGLTKDQWSSIHINLALLFLIASGFHIYYNWNAIMAYLKNRAKQLIVFNREFTVAFLVALIFILGTYFHVPPFGTVLDINESIKARQERTYGNPPYGHAERSTLRSFCKRMGLDLDQALVLLNKNNLKGVGKNETLKNIAQVNGISPQQVYFYIKDARQMAGVQASGAKSGTTVPTGLGRKTLANAAKEYDFDLETGIATLARKKIKATGQMTFKEVADAAGMAPIDVFEMMK
ncbi:MAG: hypothetical protein AMK69_09860 [Nitrospira bacterium SG8_3]|nr:MAG: hypothetical protein AMK69_09860 [Nitrospira bacterium SG8_3]